MRCIASRQRNGFFIGFYDKYFIRYFTIHVVPEKSIRHWGYHKEDFGNHYSFNFGPLVSFCWGYVFP
jgi:hypothetical protein